MGINIRNSKMYIFINFVPLFYFVNIQSTIDIFLYKFFSLYNNLDTHMSFKISTFSFESSYIYSLYIFLKKNELGMSHERNE